MATVETSMGVAFFALTFLSLILNAMFITVVLRRRRHSNGHYSLLLSLSLCHVTVASVWACLSGAATGLGWDFPGAVCRLQSFLLTLLQTLTAFTLATVTLERLLAVTFPSRHALVFVPKVPIFLSIALWGFCGVFASIHLYGSIPVHWMSTQRQCAAAFTENTRLLDFSFCVDHALPYWVICLPALIGCFIKLFFSRRRALSTGEVVLETNPGAPGDSYSARLSAVQSKFSSNYSKLHSAKERTSAKKPTLGKREFTTQGYTEPEQWDSDIEDGTGGGAKSIPGPPVKMRLYFLARTEYMMLRASAVTTFLTWLLWFPWVIARFKWNYEPYASLPDGFNELAIICTVASSTVTPIVYFVSNPYFRNAALKTFLCRR